MVVLRCCFGEFSSPFLGAAILGIVICAFLQISPKGNRKMLLFTAIGYGIFEGFSTGIYQGHSLCPKTGGNVER